MQVPEREINEARTAKKAIIKINDEIKKEGVVNFVSKVADPYTRTFRAEAIIPNEDLGLLSGMVIETMLDVGDREVYKIPQSALSLDVGGDIGVKVIDPLGIVQFCKTKQIDEDPSGIWVEGLPKDAEVITLGHAYIEPGQKLR